MAKSEDLVSDAIQKELKKVAQKAAETYRKFGFEPNDSYGFHCNVSCRAGYLVDVHVTLWDVAKVKNLVGEAIKEMK